MATCATCAALAPNPHSRALPPTAVAASSLRSRPPRRTTIPSRLPAVTAEVLLPPLRQRSLHPFLPLLASPCPGTQKVSFLRTTTAIDCYRHYPPPICQGCRPPPSIPPLHCHCPLLLHPDCSRDGGKDAKKNWIHVHYDVIYRFALRLKAIRDNACTTPDIVCRNVPGEPWYQFWSVKASLTIT